MKTFDLVLCFIVAIISAGVTSTYLHHHDSPESKFAISSNESREDISSAPLNVVTWHGVNEPAIVNYALEIEELKRKQSQLAAGLLELKAQHDREEAYVKGVIEDTQAVVK